MGGSDQWETSPQEQNYTKKISRQSVSSVPLVTKQRTKVWKKLGGIAGSMLIELPTNSTVLV